MSLNRLKWRSSDAQICLQYWRCLKTFCTVNGGIREIQGIQSTALSVDVFSQPTFHHAAHLHLKQPFFYSCLQQHMAPIHLEGWWSSAKTKVGPHFLQRSAPFWKTVAADLELETSFAVPEQNYRPFSGGCWYGKKDDDVFRCGLIACVELNGSLVIRKWLGFQFTLLHVPLLCVYMSAHRHRCFPLTVPCSLSVEQSDARRLVPTGSDPWMFGILWKDHNGGRVESAAVQWMTTWTFWPSWVYRKCLWSQG